MIKRKWLSILLALTMIFTCVPVGMFAEDENSEPVMVQEEVPTAIEAANEAPAPAVEAAPAPAVESVSVTEEKTEEKATSPEPVEEKETTDAAVVEEKKDAVAEESAPANEPAAANGDDQEQEEVQPQQEPGEAATDEAEPATSESEADDPADEENTAAEEKGEGNDADQDDAEAKDTEAAADEPTDGIEGDAEPITVETDAGNDVTPVENAENAFEAGLAKLSAGDVYADKKLKEAAGKLNEEAIVYAIARVTGDGELAANDVIRFAVNIDGEIKTLYVKNARLDYLNADETAAYKNKKHEDGVEYGDVKLEAASFTAAAVEEPEETSSESVVEEEAVEETVTEAVVPEAVIGTEETAGNDAEEIQVPDTDETVAETEETEAEPDDAETADAGKAEDLTETEPEEEEGANESTDSLEAAAGGETTVEGEEENTDEQTDEIQDEDAEADTENEVETAESEESDYEAVVDESEYQTWQAVITLKSRQTQLDIRKTASPNGKKACNGYKGEVVTVLSEQGEWAYIRAAEGEGYIMLKFLEKVEEADRASAEEIPEIQQDAAEESEVAPEESTEDVVLIGETDEIVEVEEKSTETGENGVDASENDNNDDSEAENGELVVEVEETDEIVEVESSEAGTHSWTEAPYDAKAEQTGDGEVKLTWSVYEPSEAYSVYEKIGGSEKVVGYSSTTEATIKGVAEGEHSYVVYGRKLIDGSWKWTAVSNIATVTVEVETHSWTEAPYDAKAEQTGDGEVKLTWSVYEPSEAYSVYEKIGGSEKVVGYSSTTEATIKGVAEGEHSYVVYGRKLIDGSWKWTAVSNIATVTVDSSIVENGVTYKKLPDSTLVVVSYDGTEKNVTIPDTVNGMKVTKIGEGAFEGNTTIESIDLPDSITVICARAFKGCSNLREMR